jgi:L-aminoadipate-semialdehyde dehydrogenase
LRLTPELDRAKSFIGYAQDYEELVKQLRPLYDDIPQDFGQSPLTIFLTGASGFLGSFVLHNLMTRQTNVKKVFCLVRASDSEAAFCRLRESVSDRGIWEEDWVHSGRVEVVAGDLALPQFGLSDEEWWRIAGDADVILHNGALVRSSSLLVINTDAESRFTGSSHTPNYGQPMSWLP